MTLKSMKLPVKANKLTIKRRDIELPS